MNRTRRKHRRRHRVFWGPFQSYRVSAPLYKMKESGDHQWWFMMCFIILWLFYIISSLSVGKSVSDDVPVDAGCVYCISVTPIERGGQIPPSPMSSAPFIYYSAGSTCDGFPIEYEILARRKPSSSSWLFDQKMAQLKSTLERESVLDKRRASATGWNRLLCLRLLTHLKMSPVVCRSSFRLCFLPAHTYTILYLIYCREGCRINIW